MLSSSSKLIKKKSVVFKDLESTVKYSQSQNVNDSSILPLFPALVKFSFLNTQEYDGSVPIHQGEIVDIFGNSLKVTGDILDNFTITEGWVQIRKRDGNVGFVPFDYLVS